MNAATDSFDEAAAARTRRIIIRGGQVAWAIPELVRILSYVSRMGVTIAEHAGTQWTEVARYLENSGLLRDKADLLRMDIMAEDAEEARVIEGIKKLIS